MTKTNIPQGARESFTEDRRHQDDQASRAGTLLRHAAEAVDSGRPSETTADRAQRLRGAAVLAQTAALELAVTCGWSEAAASAEQAGLLDGEREARS
jgi:hypothetical protein